MAGRDRKRKNLAKMRTQMDEQIDAMQSAEQTGQDDAKGKRRGHEGDGEEETEIDQKRRERIQLSGGHQQTAQCPNVKRATPFPPALQGIWC